MSIKQLAIAANCPLLETQRVLTGDESAQLGSVLAVADALGFTVLAVPKPAAAAVAAGAAVTEPVVKTRVAAALESLSRDVIVCFTDLDGVVHAAGDSRIDDRGTLVGEGLFRWWPRLREVLQEFPNVRLVIHSSWRKYWPTLESLRELLPPDMADMVWDITDPRILSKHESVVEYLANHPEVSGYVVLEDEPDQFPAEGTVLVECHPKEGLGSDKALSALRSALEAQLRGRSNHLFEK